MKARFVFNGPPDKREAILAQEGEYMRPKFEKLAKAAGEMMDALVMPLKVGLSQIATAMTTGMTAAEERGEVPHATASDEPREVKVIRFHVRKKRGPLERAGGRIIWQ